jgi:L-ascorbate metabolism protein UlaG (beta-lactamase superfamily)
MLPEELIKNIRFLGHASLKIKLGNKTIFVDLWKIKEEKDKADIILVTHSHYDHYSELDIKKIAKETTILLSCKEVVSQTSVKNKHVLLPFEETKIDDITIQGFPAYNINKPFHPKSNNWLGFIIKHKDISIYIAGELIYETVKYPPETKIVWYGVNQQGEQVASGVYIYYLCTIPPGYL